MFEMKKMPANNMQYVESKPVISLKEGQQLLVRVYPWYNGTATGKTICLSDLTIHGMAVDASGTGIQTIASQPQAAGSKCYDLLGRSHNSFRSGLNIVRTNDGSIKKIIK
jgi:hypothetical protein